MSDAEDRVRMALWKFGSAIRWLGTEAPLRLKYCEDDLLDALHYVRQARAAEAEARDRMAAAAVAPVDAA